MFAVISLVIILICIEFPESLLYPVRYAFDIALLMSGTCLLISKLNVAILFFIGWNTMFKKYVPAIELPTTRCWLELAIKLTFALIQEGGYCWNLTFVPTLDVDSGDISHYVKLADLMLKPVKAELINAYLKPHWDQHRNYFRKSIQNFRLIYLAENSGLWKWWCLD